MRAQDNHYNNRSRYFQEKFDAHLIMHENCVVQQKTFTNDNKRFEEFKTLIPRDTEVVVVAIEATGGYGENLVRYLYSL